MEWKELTKKDAQKSLALEMEKLLVPAPEPEKLSLQREFDGFQGLFGKFIHETGPSVHWDRIEKLPHDAVSDDILIYKARCASVRAAPSYLKGVIFAL